jgi:hypothetical protein
MMDDDPSFLDSGASVTQWSEQAPFTSEIVASILATDSRERSLSTLWRKSWVLSEGAPVSSHKAIWQSGLGT